VKIEFQVVGIIGAACGAIVYAGNHPRYECRSTDLCQPEHARVVDGHEREPRPFDMIRVPTVAVATSSSVVSISSASLSWAVLPKIT